jgi:LemA protein
MNTSLIIIIALAALALFAAMFVVGIYNKLVGLRNRFKNAYAQIDVQLKRRYDLIPNLVETATAWPSRCSARSPPTPR